MSNSLWSSPSVTQMIDDPFTYVLGWPACRGGQKKELHLTWIYCLRRTD